MSADISVTEYIMEILVINDAFKSALKVYVFECNLYIGTSHIKVHSMARTL